MAQKKGRGGEYLWVDIGKWWWGNVRSAHKEETKIGIRGGSRKIIQIGGRKGRREEVPN